MSYVQVISSRPPCNGHNLYQSWNEPCIALTDVTQLYKNSLRLDGLRVCRYSRLPKTHPRVTACASSYNGSSDKQHSLICFFGGKEKFENVNEVSSFCHTWHHGSRGVLRLPGLCAAYNNENEPSIEDVLRKQMEYSDGGGGKTPGGGGGNDNGSGDEGLSGILDEFLQVILGTIGFIFLYIYIIEGEEITVLVKDYLKFLFGGQRSYRLRRLMYQWGRFFQRIREKKEVQTYWLETAIINTPTWWDSPMRYKRMLRSYVASQEDVGRSYSGSREDEDDY